MDDDEILRFTTAGDDAQCGCLAFFIVESPACSWAEEAMPVANVSPSQSMDKAANHAATKSTSRKRIVTGPVLLLLLVVVVCGGG